ncbi:MAG: hypothetical protein ACOYLC_03920 [Armatimonadaceae bacterium]
MTSESVPPLDASPLTEYSEPKSDKWLMWLPPIGWLWSHMRWQRWARPNRMAYEKTLRERPIIPVTVWGNQQQQTAGLKLLTIIDDNFGWPNMRFVPWDPVSVAMWAYEDGLDDMAAISDIEKAFGVTYTDDEWLEMYAGTLAELIDVLLLKAIR